jgi:hypothetical protein
MRIRISEVSKDEVWMRRDGISGIGSIGWFRPAFEASMRRKRHLGGGIDKGGAEIDMRNSWGTIAEHLRSGQRVLACSLGP